MGRFAEALSARLKREQPTRLTPGKTASVAVVIRDVGDDEEVLLIRRADREGDAWSGQVAFPGGMAGPSDGSFQETASREAKEELGADLSGSSAFVGYMRERRTHTRAIVVVPSVFVAAAPQSLKPNQKEVASYEWASLGELGREHARSSYLIPRTGGQIPVPCIFYGGLVIWGLTERILSEILELGAKA